MSFDHAPVRPFGLRMIQAAETGFSFSVAALSTNDTFKTYQPKNHRMNSGDHYEGSAF